MRRLNLFHDDVGTGLFDAGERGKFLDEAPADPMAAVRTSSR
jgi:hypothetical protein